MAVFQQHFWGYEITYPDEWTQATHGDVEAFAMHTQALSPDYDGPHMGYLLVRAEFNPFQDPIEPLWNEYAAKIAIMHGAKKIGSAPFKVGTLAGFEAELQLPQKENRRLWMGVLAAGGVVLHLMVTHRKTEKALFQPVFSRMVASLRFAARVEGVRLTESGLPLPQGYLPAAVDDVYPQAEAGSRWEAFRGPAAADALQIFYLREAPVYGWQTLAFSPYPNPRQAGTEAVLVLNRPGSDGTAVRILPSDSNQPQSPANLVIQHIQKRS